MTSSPSSRQRTAGRGHLQRLCSWTFETERACWTPGCPSARDPGIPLSLTLSVTGYLCCSSCILDPVCSLPSVRYLGPPAPSLSSTLEPWKDVSFLVCSPGRPALSSLPGAGWLLPTWQLRVPALHLLWPRASTASAQGCREAVGGFRLPLCPSSSEGLLPPVRCSGQVSLAGTEARLPRLRMRERRLRGETAQGSGLPPGNWRECS